MHWRPKAYWKAGTKVALDTDLRGVSLGPGTYGSVNADRHIAFSIGASHVSVADAKTHRMKVYVNGKLTKDFPASLGKEVSGRYSHSGVHIVTEKKRSMTMDSTTFGLALDAGGYKVPVQFATRISNSGEFVHSGAVVGRAAGQGERLARVREPVAGERGLVLRDLQAGRRRQRHGDAGAADEQGHRRPGLERAVEPMG